jgi:RimJ/RimL family protein N-acetyltransferase
MSAAVILRTKRLALRPTNRDDERGIAAAGRDPAIRAMPWFGAGFQDSWAEPWVRRAMSEGAAGHRLFSICTAKDGGYVGSVVLCRVADNASELAYWVLPSHRGSGVATEAVTALLQWARENLPGVHIWAKANHANLASQRVLAKSGFRERERGEIVYFDLPD